MVSHETTTYWPTGTDDPRRSIETETGISWSTVAAVGTPKRVWWPVT